MTTAAVEQHEHQVAESQRNAATPAPVGQLDPKQEHAIKQPEPNTFNPRQVKSVGAPGQAFREFQHPRFYRLKAGAHSIGAGVTFHQFFSSDPSNNVVGSYVDLAKIDPDKWEAIPEPQGLVPAASWPGGSLDAPHPQADVGGPRPGFGITHEDRTRGADENALSPDTYHAEASRTMGTFPNYRDWLKQKLYNKDENEQATQAPPRSQASAPVPPASPSGAGGQAQPSNVGRPASPSPIQARPQEDLESKTVEQLKQIADDEEIDLKGKTRKDELISAIKSQRGAR